MSTSHATRGLQFREPLIFEGSTPGRAAHSLPQS
ncbi:MAG: hypothetical protein ACI9MR_003208, partial [Myxococcota bacterium]